MGKILISRIYYVKGLGHNPFSVGVLILNNLNDGYDELAKQGLAKGLPKLKYTKDHLCSACQMGKSKKESHPHKPEPNTNEKLQMLHMVKFLRMKDEALKIIINFLKQAQVSLNATVRYLRIDNGTEFMNQSLRNYTEEIPYELLKDHKPELKYLYVFGALCYPTNDFENLEKLYSKADIGIFIGYLLSKKAYRIYNKRTRQIMETINVEFDEFTQMASEQHGLGLELQGLTSGHISSELVLNYTALTSAKPLTKNDWDLLFQPMFDEYFKPLSAVSTLISTAALHLQDTTEASSSTSIDKDAPYPSTLPNNKTTTSPINSSNVEPNEKVTEFV
nr:integrase, catalytic region, zinc finger, CCHC-type, peptidase aspartic, catalytic [Tanacetum cinerariifolium]